MAETTGTAKRYCDAIKDASNNADVSALREIVFDLYSTSLMEDPGVFTLVCELVRHSDSTVAGRAMAALQDYNVDCHLALPPFLALLEDNNLQVRMCGFHCIRRLTTVDDRLRKIVIDSLQSDHGGLRDVVRQLILGSPNPTIRNIIEKQKGSG